MAHALSQNLARLRAAKGLTQQALADLAGISRVCYRDIEKGRATPREGTAQSLAKALNVSVFELFEPPPRLKSLRFRSCKTLKARERAERDQLIVETYDWLLDFNELEDVLGGKNTFDLPSRTPRSREDIADIAEDVRRTLAEACDACLPPLTDLLEDAGIKVRTFEKNSDKLNGFCLGSEDGGPAIAVNVRESIPVERRIFTAAHELGHLVLHASSFDPEQTREDEKQEREANDFASYFLMPRQRFRDEWNRNAGLTWYDRVIKTKRTFRVSWMTVLFRLSEETGQAVGDQIMRFKAIHNRRTGRPLLLKKEPDGISRVAFTKQSEPDRLDRYDFIEDRFCRLVREAVEREEIGVSRAAEMMRLSINEMRERIEEWRKFE